MATLTGEPLSETVQNLMDMEEKYGAGTYGSTPGFIVSGKGSTLVVGSVFCLLYPTAMIWHRLLPGTLKG